MPFKDNLPFLKEQTLFDLTKTFVHLYQHQYRLNMTKEISEAFSDIKIALDSKTITESKILEDFPLHHKTVYKILELAKSNILRAFSTNPSEILFEDLAINNPTENVITNKNDENATNKQSISPSPLNLTDDIIQQMQTDWDDNEAKPPSQSSSTAPRKSPLSSDSDRSLSLAQRPPREIATLSSDSGPINTLRDFVMESDTDSEDCIIPPSKCSSANPPSTISSSFLENSLFDHSANPIAVKGSLDPLSNMYTFDFTYSSKTFNSLESCYQYFQSIHFDDQENANEILKSPTPFHARALNSKFRRLKHNQPDNPKLIEWYENRVAFMKDLLKDKLLQLPLFKQTLINTGQSRLFHNTKDLFWGTGTTALTPVYTGQDKFAQLLMELRFDITRDNFESHTSSSSPTDTPPSSIIITSSDESKTTHSYPTPSKRTSPTQTGALPKKTKPAHSDSSSDSSADIPTLLRQDHLHSYQLLTPKSPWTFPQPIFKTVLIFDSNGKSASTVRPYTYTMYSFSGANYTKLYYACRSLEPYLNVENVFSYVGINSRDSNLQNTTSKAFLKYHSALSKLFPNANIFHSQIMFDPLSMSVTNSQTQNLNALNDYLKFLTRINFIPKPDTLILQFHPDGIHIRPQSLNQLTRAWFNQYIR